MECTRARGFRRNHEPAPATSALLGDVEALGDEPPIKHDVEHTLTSRRCIRLGKVDADKISPWLQAS